MELKFIEDLGNERIKEKFALIDNDIFFNYAIVKGFYKVNDKDKEMEFYSEHIQKLTEYLLNCGIDKQVIEDFKKESLKQTKKHFDMKQKAKELFNVDL